MTLALGTRRRCTGASLARRDRKGLPALLDLLARRDRKGLLDLLAPKDHRVSRDRRAPMHL